MVHVINAMIKINGIVQYNYWSVNPIIKLYFCMLQYIVLENTTN